MSEKLGWFKFYPGDWSRDLEEHPPEIEGYWIRICCKLSWEPDRGRAVKSVEQWARVMRVIDLEEARRVIAYLSNAGIADISGDPFNPGEPIAIVSRRMVRDERERRGNAQRQERHRKKTAGLTGGDASGEGSSKPRDNAAAGGKSNAPGNASSNAPGNGPKNAASRGCGPPGHASGNGGLTLESEKSEQSRDKSPPAPPAPQGAGGKRIPKLATALEDQSHPLHGLAVWFDEILWPAYPARHGRKAGKAEAWEWLARESPDATGLKRMLARLREDLAGGDWKRGIGIKDCVRWLRANDKNGWESALAAPQPGDDPYEGLDDRAGQ